MSWLQIIVALALGTVVYRWQKTVDRRTATAVELRKAYAEFLTAISEDWEAITAFSDYGIDEATNTSLPKLSRNTIESNIYIQLYGSQLIREKCTNLLEKLLKFRATRAIARTSKRSGDTYAEFLQAEAEYSLALRTLIDTIRQDHSEHISNADLDPRQWGIWKARYP